ncbi:hypothetical protein M422DRAFT_239557 [Sphaerobolus stellatus SS14]|nr:hypothetical protein M422DRAFT_239557 [Sphaerobolus stellatus SS14]
MDNEPNTHMQADPSTNPMSAIQAFKMDPSTEWVIESTPGFIAIKHKIGSSICNASTSHCMATTKSYKICLTEKNVSHTVAEAWPELVRYQDNYYRLLEDYNILKELVKAKMTQLYNRLDSHRVTIQNLGDQAQSLEKELQEAKDNSVELSPNEDLILKNKQLKELEYYVGRAQYALHGKDTAWAEKNGYCLSNIPTSDGEDNDKDPTDLPTIPEDIPQYIPIIPPTSRARTMSKTLQNNSKVICEAGIPAIGGYHPPPKQKRIIADPPASITGPAFRGTSEWIMKQDVYDTEMHRLYAEGKALQPHEQSLDHTVVMFCINEYARSLPGLPRNLVACHDDPDWMTEIIQSFNVNPSGVPRNLHLEGLHVNVNNADVWYWVNLIKPRRWDQLVAGQWKRNDSPFLCSLAPVRYAIPCHQRLNKGHFAYWLGCDPGVTPKLAQEKLEPYFIRHFTRMIWNKVTLHSQLRANEIASLKGGVMNHFRVHDDLLPFIQESPFYSPPMVGEPMDQDEPDPEPNPIQHSTGPSSLADRLDYGEGGSFSQPPADACELQARISYFDSLVPQGTTCASMVELTEELTHKLYMNNLK